jgi:hypothetical protein
MNALEDYIERYVSNNPELYKNTISDAAINGVYDGGLRAEHDYKGYVRTQMGTGMPVRIIVEIITNHVSYTHTEEIPRNMWDGSDNDGKEHLMHNFTFTAAKEAAKQVLYVITNERS